MIFSTLQKLSPEIIGILIGMAIRHFLMPFISGKEVADMLKYLKKHEMTKEEVCELKSNLAQTQLWIELHEQACPYVKKKFAQQENSLKN